MGRQIRRVPPNWEHPVMELEGDSWLRAYQRGQPTELYRPILERDLSDWERQFKNWKEEFDLWVKGEHSDQTDPASIAVHEEYNESENLLPTVEKYIEKFGPPPDPRNYLPYDKDSKENTWWAVYETVSEGTPITPSFATADELIEYLATEGDFWRQKKDQKSPWDRDAAERFVKEDGWAPSAVCIPGVGLFVPGDHIPKEGEDVPAED